MLSKSHQRITKAFNCFFCKRFCSPIFILFLFILLCKSNHTHTPRSMETRALLCQGPLQNLFFCQYVIWLVKGESEKGGSKGQALHQKSTPPSSWMSGRSFDCMFPAILPRKLSSKICLFDAARLAGKWENGTGKRHLTNAKVQRTEIAFRCAKKIAKNNIC